MIVAAAVSPGAPFLVPGVADPVAARSSDLIAACEATVRGLAGVDRIVLISAGRNSDTRLFPAGIEVSPSPLRRSDFPSRSGPSPAFAVGSMVGRALLDRAFPDTVPAPVDVLETGDDPAVAQAAIDHHVGPVRVGLLVVADGAACHGDHAPGRRDDRSAGFDDAVAGALAAGDPAALARACADRDLARQLLAITDPLLVLAELAADDPPDVADLLYRETPYGIGYLVASWRWSWR